MTGSFTYVVSTAEDNNPLLVKQNIATMIESVQESHPTCCITKFSWQDYAVINQVNYTLEYTCGD